jgi:Ca2+-binding EF-hand superfamily protein
MYSYSSNQTTNQTTNQTIHNLIYYIKEETPLPSPSNDVCTDTKLLALCTCKMCIDAQQFLFDNTTYTKDDIKSLRITYKEHKMTQQRFIHIMYHIHINEIIETILLERIFQYFNTEKSYTISFYLFVIIMSIIQNRNKIVNTEQFFFDIVSEKDVITVDSVERIFKKTISLDSTKVTYYEIIAYYIEKWDRDKKGFITHSEYTKGMKDMNPSNKDYILSIFQGYSLPVQ